MQTFKHKTISDYYCLITGSSCEYLSSKSINYGAFPVVPSEDWAQCPESEYLRVRDQALHFLNEMRPKITGASFHRERVIVTDEEQPTYKRL